MSELWNNPSLLPPPVNMFLCVKRFDIAALRHVCNNIIKVLTKQSPLHKESALCSRFLYKYDRKFSNDIGYRNFKKVHTSLKKYLALNLLKDIENFMSAVPVENDEKYLPTRQMLEYILLRIITFSMIMLRICVCAKQAAIFYLNRIKRGESHWMSLLPYALLSRLWSMTMVLVQHATTWYSNLFPYLNKLELKGLNFLPHDYKLPENLEIWLDLKNVDNFGRFDWNQKKLVAVQNILPDDEDESDLFDNILSFVNQSNVNDLELDDEFKPLLDKYVNNDVPSVKKIDYGEVMSRENFQVNRGEVLSRDSFKIDQGDILSRESFKVLLNTQNKVTGDKNQQGNNITTKQDKGYSLKNATNYNKINKNNEHSSAGITNASYLKKFIEKEETFRNESNSKSLTVHLSLMQWHALKNALLQLCDNDTNRKIDKKFKKIWKEKCLDYK